MGDASSGQDRLQDAIRAALEAAARSGRLEGGVRHELAATLAAVSQRLGVHHTASHVRVEPAPGQVLALVETRDPVALDVVTSFMEGARARRLGSAQAWLLPLSDLPVSRWARALRRVTAAAQRAGGGVESALPIRCTMAWSEGGELLLATFD